MFGLHQHRRRKGGVGTGSRELVDQEGFDYKAASEVLGVPARTVSSRLAYARATLRRTLEDSAHRAYGLPDQGKEL